MTKNEWKMIRRFISLLCPLPCSFFPIVLFCLKCEYKLIDEYFQVYFFLLDSFYLLWRKETLSQFKN